MYGRSIQWECSCCQFTAEQAERRQEYVAEMETHQGSIVSGGNTAIRNSNHRKNESEDFEMIENNQSNSREMEHALKALEQAKARVANERKKLNEKRRKEENHHKYLMGGIIVKYFPECYQFDEAELNKILRVALATNECQQIIKNIKGQNGENANQNTVEQGRADKGGANA